MSIPENVFREYDIRGVVGSELDEDFAYLLGRAYGALARESNQRTIAIGYDCRHSSPGFADSLGQGVAAEGLDVVLTGMGPTPQLYFSIFQHKLGGGIQVTGSHNPSNMNGFKICLGTQTLSGQQIRDLRSRMLELADSEPSVEAPGQISQLDITPEYIETLIENSKPFVGERKLKIVVDAGNGVAGMIGPAVLRGIGCEVIELYCEPDGDFPNHHPDPTVLENLKDSISAVHEHSADFGIGWDGDGDRIGVVNEKGEVIFGDMLLLLYGRQILAKNPGATIIGDVKCSSILFDDLNARGGNAIMWKTGHSLIKKKLLETSGDLAGEMSGHIFFKHRYYGFDDGVYAASRLAEIVSATDQPLSALFADLPEMVSTPEIRVDCPESIKFEVARRAQEAFSEFEVSTIDGVRIQFENGWGLVRASNTQPVLVMRFESINHNFLEEYQSLVQERIERIRSELSEKATST